MASKWPAEKKARCLGAMWASATEDGGEWFPHYALVESQEGVDSATLYRWWHGRDRAGDETFRKAAARARDDAAASGARAWFDEVLRLGRDRVRDLLTEERHVGAEVDASARATKGALEAGILVAEHLGLTGDGESGDSGGDSSVVEIRVRGALARVRT